MAVAGGPAQAVLRPSRIEDPVLGETLEKEALYGAIRIFVRGGGSEAAVSDDALVLEQVSQRGRNGRSIRLDPQGSLLVRLPVESDGHGTSVILVETLQEQLAC